MLLSNPLSTSQNTTITTNSIGYNSGGGAGQPPSAIRTWNYAGTYVSTTATSSPASSPKGKACLLWPIESRLARIYETRYVVLRMPPEITLRNNRRSR